MSNSNSFKTIGLVWKDTDTPPQREIEQLSRFLEQRKCRVLTGLVVLTEERKLVLDNSELLGEECDLIIAAGGDGTFLMVARSLLPYEVPLLCVNLGRLGFLADIPPNNMVKALSGIFDGDFIEESRIALQASIISNGEEIYTTAAVNDAVVNKWNSSRMVEFETYVDGRFLNSQRSDGLIIATPTGSTAYAFSAGGPIIYPTMDAILIVPICPHTMTVRPLVLGADDVIEVVITSENWEPPNITCDGQHTRGLNAGSRVRIVRSERRVRLIHPASHDYFETLRAKLRWGA
ncbi:MAG: NAD(+) kinase [Gammaproteobacteria bacterium]|nr:NAD(+) kinase [Gammaproteobacteria bacterium]